MMELIIPIGFSLCLLGVGLFVGGANERRHLRELDQREAETQHILVTQLPSYPLLDEPSLSTHPPRLIMGEAVIASDYLKTFLAGLRKLFGGEMSVYRMMMTRARREALIRCIEQAQRDGFNALCNVRMESADIGGSAQGTKDAQPMATILVTATAYMARTSKKPEPTPAMEL